MRLITAKSSESLARVDKSQRKPLRVALIQTKWHQQEEVHLQILEEGIKIASESGASFVFLQELTLYRYPADVKPETSPNSWAEDLETGKTFQFAKRMANKFNVNVHASLFERSREGEDGLGYNTAIMVSPSGDLLGKTRKVHIPKTAGYYEDHYFRPGPASEDCYPVFPMENQVDGEKFHLGMPTCWDQWFPELARIYSLKGAEILVYPTAIGSEPDHPNFDTQPLWQKVIVGNGISNGTFMIAVNRWGNEGLINFYGTSFISDPYGRILVQAGRDEDAVLVADLDLDQKKDWLKLFPFMETRRPETYSDLVDQN